MCTCFTCRGGSRGVGCLTLLGAAVRWGVSAQEKPARALGSHEDLMNALVHQYACATLVHQYISEVVGPVVDPANERVEGPVVSQWCASGVPVLF